MSTDEPSYSLQKDNIHGNDNHSHFNLMASLGMPKVSDSQFEVTSEPSYEKKQYEQCLRSLESHRESLLIE